MLSLLSAASTLALQGDLEAVRAGRRELEDEVRALRDGLGQMEKVKETVAMESEDIMKALQGQVDSANKVCPRDVLRRSLSNKCWYYWYY